MPRVSAFYGIVIALYYNDHAPPHFHAIYGSREAQIRIDTLEVLAGSLPRRAQALVLEWTQLHRADLWSAWDKARRHEPLPNIEPLD